MIWRSEYKKWWISSRVVRYWTRYEIRELRLSGKTFGYSALLREVPVIDGADRGYSYVDHGVSLSLTPYSAAELRERDDKGRQIFHNCHSTFEKAMWAAIYDHLREVDDPALRDYRAKRLYREANPQ